MNTKILFFLALVFCTLSTPMSAHAITASAGKHIFIIQGGNPNFEEQVGFDAQVSFTAPTQLNQNVQVTGEIFKTGQGGTPYTGRVNLSCGSGCTIGQSVFNSGSTILVNYPISTTLSISNYGTHNLSMDVTEVPNFVGSTHHIDYSSTPGIFTVNAPPPLPQCSDGTPNDSDGLTDAADPECWTCPGLPGSYLASHNSESVAPTGGSCPVPSGSITAGNCSIPINGNICSSLIVWSSNNANNPVVELNNGPVYGGVSGSQSFPMNPNSSPLTFILRASGVGSQELDRDTAQAFCVPDSTWNGSSCVADPPTVYSCTGIAPNNAGLCSGDNTGLTANTPNTLVPACTVGTKCEHTCDVGYELSGGVCVVSSSPSASINAPDCDILAGQSSCTSSVSWNTSGITSPSVRQNGTEFSTLTSSGGTSRVLLRGTYTFTVYDGATERASDIATAECISGTVWDGDSCEVSPPLSGNISASPNPCEVAIGASNCTSNVSWNTTGAPNAGVWTSTGGLFSSLANSVISYPSPLIRPDQSVTLNLRDNGSSGTILDSVTITAECILGSAWNGSSCQASAVSGNITANPIQCDIAIGASTCTSDISWSTSGATTPGVWTSAGVLFSSLANSMGTYPSPAVGRSAPVTLNLRNNNSSGTILDSVTITAECTLGSAWDGDSCEASATVPDIPTPTATPGSCGTGQIIVSWPAVTNAQGYDIQIDGGGWLSIGNVLSYNHTGLVAGSSHNYRVRAWNIVGPGTQSNLVSATAPAVCSGTPKLIICPTTPPQIPVYTSTPLQAWYWPSYSGTPTCADGGSMNVSNSTSWGSRDTGIASVSAGTNAVDVLGVSVGTVNIDASYLAVDATKQVQVIPGGVPIDPPVITIVSNPSIVRSGQTAPVTITILADYTLTCTLSGALAGSPAINHSASVTSTDYTRITVPLTAARVARVTCPAPNGVSYSEETTISVIPTFQEI